MKLRKRKQNHNQTQKCEIAVHILEVKKLDNRNYALFCPFHSYVFTTIYINILRDFRAFKMISLCRSISQTCLINGNGVNRETTEIRHVTHTHNSQLLIRMDGQDQAMVNGKRCILNACTQESKQSFVFPAPDSPWASPHKFE